MIFQNDIIVEPLSSPHGGLWSLADLRTLSIAPGVEDFGLFLTLGRLPWCPYVEVFGLWLTLALRNQCPWLGGLLSLADIGKFNPVPLEWRYSVFG